MSEVKYPFEIEGRYIAVFYQRGDTPLVFGRWGYLESNDLDGDIEDFFGEYEFTKGDGEYHKKK